MKRTIIIASGALLVAVICSLIFATYKFALAAFAGFLIAAASFLIISMVVVRLVSHQGRSGLFAFIGIIKMGILGVLLWWLLSVQTFNPIAFLLGFSTVVAALIFESIFKKPAL